MHTFEKPETEPTAAEQACQTAAIEVSYALSQLKRAMTKITNDLAVADGVSRAMDALERADAALKQV